MLPFKSLTFVAELRYGSAAIGLSLFHSGALLMKLIARACCPLFLTLQLLAIPASAQSQSVTIEKLVTDGWEVAGYIAASDIRSLILFKHRDHKHLVQCSVLVDVTRAQRLVIACYELK
jgi:hypothetical protein